MKKRLYIPIEIYRRELNGMLVLSLVAAMKGWKVLLGGKSVLFPNLHRLPQGAVLLKSVVPGELKNQKLIESMGHHVTSIDAEGLILNEGDVAITGRYNEETIARSSVLCFWGKEQFNRTKALFPGIVSKGVITGSPVADFWRYQKHLHQKQNNVKKRPTILFATSFTTPNHYIGVEMARSLLINAIGKANRDEHLKNFLIGGELQNTLFPKYKDLADQLFAAHPDYHFILRPHINENPQPWAEIAKKYKNVTMSTSGDISKLLLDADILIHFNSTTSIEAAFYGKKIITFLPKNEIPDDQYQCLNRHALLASHVGNSIEETKELVNKAVKGALPPTNLDLELIVENASSDLIYQCSESIMNALDKIQFDKAAGRPFPSSVQFHLNFRQLKTIVKLRIIWLLGWVDHYTRLFNGKYAPSKNNYRYGKTKQGSINYGELFELAESMKRDFGFTDVPIEIKKIRDGLISIERTT